MPTEQEENALLEKKSTVLDIEISSDDLHSKLGGGIPKETLVLLEGEHGSGKSIVSQRILYGILKNGSKAAYISTEFDTLAFLKQMESVSYTVTDYCLDEKLIFLPMFPFLGETRYDPTVFDRIFMNDKIYKYDVIIFDTLSSFILDESLNKTDYFRIIKMLKKLNSLGKTIILCMDPKGLNDEFLEIMKSTADLYFKLEIRMVLGTLLRIINVVRFKRPIADVQNSVPFRVEPGRGIAIELASLS